MANGLIHNYSTFILLMFSSLYIASEGEYEGSVNSSKYASIKSNELYLCIVENNGKFVISLKRTFNRLSCESIAPSSHVYNYDAMAFLRRL